MKYASKIMISQFWIKYVIMQWNMKYINTNNNSECDHIYLNLKMNDQNSSTLQLSDPRLILLSYHTV